MTIERTAARGLDQPSEPASPPLRQIAILGGGVAGMACALWLKLIGYAPVILERNAALGGQLLGIDRINRWVLGFRYHDNRQLASRYAEHVGAEDVQVRLGIEMIAASRDGAGLELAWHEPDRQIHSLGVAALVIATGIRVRMQESFGAATGVEALSSSGLLSFFPIDHLNRPEQWAGRTVAVVGGGDNAHFTACDLAETAAATHLLMHSAPHAASTIRRKVEGWIERGAIIEHPEVEIAGFRNTDPGIEIRLTRNGSPAGCLTVDRIFARTGFAPNTDFPAELGPLAELAKDGRGYLSRDAWMRTSHRPVYAIGDVGNPDHPSVVTAIADGAVAARAIERDLG
jgi:thioredoxin reductase (NADPH)